ncbi:MAG: hypothetical protein ACLQIQ_16840 [Beijerinckiaceae bacterium]
MPYVETSYQLVESFVRVNDPFPLGQLLRATAAVIDLDEIRTIEKYLAAVSKETKGKYLRSANKARRLGYYARRIGQTSHSAGRHLIRASKLVRSRGLVWEALNGPRPSIGDQSAPHQRPSCCEHWRIDWGVFLGDDTGERLVAYASLQRAGNAVHILSFMGHGTSLTDGVTKILIFEIMDWLLARQDPCVEGLDYLIYGSIEEGSRGLADWKRYARFRPTKLICAAPPRRVELIDFDAKAYLALNPDVCAAGVDPYRHYLWHGILEGRKIRPD